MSTAVALPDTDAQHGGGGNLPPGPRWPKLIQGLSYVVAREKMMLGTGRRYGTAFSVNLPFFGRSVVIGDPALVKQLFQTSTDAARGVEPNLDLVLGRGSMFGLQGEEHRRRRKLLVPPFHGKRMRAYEALIEQETRKEITTWPEDRPFAVMPSTMRITLNAILRAVFGAEGEEFDQLRELMPKLVELGSRLALIPVLHHDLGPCSPWGKFVRLRRDADRIIGSLISKATNDPHLADREDILALMLQARYDDGTAMAHKEIADELLTLLAAGHETTATSLAWAVERLRRHPDVLARLVDDIDAGGSDLLQATIYEVQRTRPVIDAAARQVVAPSIPLGDWVIPQGYTVIASIALTHENETVFPDAGRFDPDRFLDGIPDTYAWVPFGGGTRRCIGAAFANMEMTIVLRTILGEYTLAPTDTPGEKRHNRGIAIAPKDGGQAVVRRRTPATAAPTTHDRDHATTDGD